MAWSTLSLDSLESDSHHRRLVGAHRAFSPEQRAIFPGAFEITERTLAQVLRSRGDVVVPRTPDGRPRAGTECCTSFTWISDNRRVSRAAGLANSVRST